MNKERQGALFLWQRFLHVEICRKNEELLDIQLFFQETSREDRLKAELFIKDFTIKEAIWERPRANRSVIKPLSLVFLHGRSIYLKEARNLKKAILDWGKTEVRSSPFDVSGVSDREEEFYPSLPEREHIADLFLELIANALQAEVFLLSERGISSLQEYDRFFSEIYKDTCILYSSPRKELTEYVYTQGQKRFDSLFSRSKSIIILKHNLEGEEREKKECFIILGHLSDSFHEMAFYLNVSPSSNPPYRIEKADGNFLRSPDSLCREAAVRLRDLAGARLLPENKRELISILAGPGGCSHLSDLVIEAARALQELDRAQTVHQEDCRE